MNPFAHFELQLVMMPEERLNALRSLEVRGPNPYLAQLLTKQLRRLVKNEQYWRAYGGGYANHTIEGLDSTS